MREIDQIKKFFKTFEIEDDEIKYYYKRLYLNINFENVKKHIKESFFKLLIYYIVQKHPKFYSKATLNLPQFTEKYIGKEEELLKILQNSIVYFIKDESYPRLFKIEIQIEEKTLDLYLTEDDPIIKIIYIE
ncbi:hypothetical protein LCGC14_1993000 [marine sediment metagenome]|uniref:Uncharacterized protein n=1 Tax=marine sediment metagenome TaxID=412755 RepID=A0A0F9F5A2_9ZZZZ